jgi:hypothetical protein
MDESPWRRCVVCAQWMNLDSHEDGVDYMTIYGTPERRRRVDLEGKRPYASVRCLCTTCIKAIAELANEIEDASN